MLGYYKLNGHIPVRCSQWDNGSRRVAETYIRLDVWVSTVFLVIDHNYSGIGPPILFETMIFGGWFRDHEYQERYCTWEEAEIGHSAAVEYATETLTANGLLISALEEKS